MAAMDGMTGGGAEAVLARLRDRTLDLGARNRLLNAKEGRLLVRVDAAEAAVVEDVLASGRQVALRGVREGEDPAEAVREGVRARKAVLHLPMGEDAARARIVEIYRRARSRFEETGLQTAYLGIGTAQWPEARGEPGTAEAAGQERPRRCAPVILQPVRIGRKQAAGPYWMEAVGDAAPNTTLMEWLRREHGVEVALDEPLPADEHGVDVAAVLESVRRQVEGRGGIEVGDGAMLGIFEFARLALWAELGRLEEKGLESLGGVAQELLGREGAGFGPSGPVDARAAEAGRGRREHPVPLEADASQLEALEKAREGRSFILQGPPGTGKSQTIANVIASLVAEGRRVLFCAEKRAAIEAVSGRLEAAGLGRWVLDVADGADPKEAVRSLNEALEAAEAGPRATAGDGGDSTEHRDALNAYEEALHAPRAWGVSVARAMALAGGRPAGPGEAGAALPGGPGEEPGGIDARCEIARGWVLEMAAVDEARARVLRGCGGPGEVEEVVALARGLQEAQAWEARCREDLARAKAQPWWRRWWDKGVARRRLEAARDAGEHRLQGLEGSLGCRDVPDEALAGWASGDVGWCDALARRKRAGALEREAGAWWPSVEPAACAAAHALAEGERDAVAGLLDTMRRSWWQGWAQRWTREDPVLGPFNAHRHEDALERFRAREDAWTGGEGAAEVHRRCEARLALPDPAGRAREETAARQQRRRIVQEGRKKRRVAPVRVLMEASGDVVRALKPCFMMSPLAAARSLPEGEAFDTVVMDEASQIRPEDALGVIARARGSSGDAGPPQVILAGDPRQMPPTRFFERQADDGDGDDGEAVESMESILDLAAARQMPVHRLRFHYRSRHEALIQFSNRRYYGGELVTFPEAERDPGAVDLREAGGVYDAQRNVEEARAVAAYVCAHVAGPAGADESIGVVTFNKKQERLVEDLLDKARMEDPALEEAWGREGRPAPCVRNLETAQGDERDVVVLSTTYGPDPKGRQRSHFGPLNGEGGERRLNVAVTRARKRMVVFTSLDVERVGTERSPRGVRDLRGFLRYAGGAREEQTEHEGSLGGYESPLEEQIAAALEARGWSLVPQVGMAGYRIDVGVRDPRSPGRFLAGVEADGAQYHAARTARDRDRLRQRMLEARGWRLVRVWSPDWWRDPEGVADRLDARLRGLLEGAAEAAGHDV